MNSRERFELCMNHRNPDRPPLDLGATSLTGMRPLSQQRLKELLGFSGRSVLINNGIDERILEWAGTDFRSVGGIVSLPGVYRRQISDTCVVDCWGVRREKIDGEWQITKNPLRSATQADLEAFEWPEPYVDDRLLRQWEAEAKALCSENKYVVIGEHPVFGILELGCWMCGYDDFMMRLAAEPDFVRRFFDKILAIQLEVIEQYYVALGPYIDLTMSGDDFGTQTSPFMSPKMFEQLIVPWFSARIARTKELARCTYWHHSCGSVVGLLDQIIACGVDILNPVQTSAWGMDPKSLKTTYGDRIVFWGGVDVQDLLRKATPGQVREQVCALAEILGAQGGYVMAPAHQVQDDIPPENIVSWIEAIRDGQSIPRCT
jgi:uroporphyrinogen decarboxylase